jgi:dihydrodipicolinate synthase/N-acetylneuraminate lyase
VTSRPENVFDARQHLLRGQVIPALPLALTPARRWDERSQRAVLRYYCDAGVGGLAVGVHSTEFAIRQPKIGLYQPILALSAETARAWPRKATGPLLLIAGLCGRTRQALTEAGIARGLGYHAGLLSVGAWAQAPEKDILRHCRAVAREIPLIGFYLQPAVGGRILSYHFWRQFAEIPELVAIKMAPFNRYQTLDVVRAVMEAGRDDVALYTGNDDNIIADLLTPFRFAGRTRFIDGGLLGQWGVWTERAVALFRDLQRGRTRPNLAAAWLLRNVELTDANSAIFDAAHQFAGCIPGIHEVLRRQGLLRTTACLNRHEGLSPGQAREITRITRAYPWMVDDAFVASRLATWRA